MNQQEEQFEQRQSRYRDISEVPADFVLEESIRNRDYSNFIVSNLLIIGIGLGLKVLIWAIVFVAVIDVLFFLMKDYVIMNVYDRGIAVLDSVDQSRALIIRSEDLVTFHVTGDNLPAVDLAFVDENGETVHEVINVYNYTKVYDVLDRKYPEKNYSYINQERVRNTFAKSIGPSPFSSLISSIKKFFEKK